MDKLISKAKIKLQALVRQIFTQSSKSAGIRVKDGWCYLTIVMDLYARRSDSPNTDHTESALNKAYAVRMKPKEILFHFDQGKGHMTTVNNSLMSSLTVLR